MKIICNKNDLLNGINIVLKAVSQRSTLSILQCIYLQVSNNEFKMVSNDLELGIETKVDAEIVETGSVSLESRIFSDIVRKLEEGKVEIIVDENNHTKISCEKAEFNISGLPGSEFIMLPEIEKLNSFSISQLNLKEMIHQTIFSIAQEEIRPILTGELIEIKDNILNIVSIDGFRISIRNKIIETNIEQLKVVVPGKTLNEIRDRKSVV